MSSMHVYANKRIQIFLAETFRILGFVPVRSELTLGWSGGRFIWDPQ
jgi:hypothetical protein